MISENFPVVLNKYISVKDAANQSGYSMQYLRRLLRSRRVSGIKIGQQWFIDMMLLEEYVDIAIHSADKRFGSKSNKPTC